MKQWNSKMKKLCSEPLKTLFNELNRPGRAWFRNFSENSYLHYSILALTKLKYFVLRDKVLLVTKRRSERETRNRHQRVFRKDRTIYYIYKIMIIGWIFCDSDKYEIRLPFYRYFSAF